jgi:GNAT superfamily N-acetyltransferase
MDESLLEMRLARESDLPQLEEISRNTWDGDDYLARVAPDWIREGGFYVAAVGDRVAGCARLAMMPASVIWLEGLRVHPELRGRGYGKALSRFVLSEARRLVSEGAGKHVEFSTYYRNSESIGITTAEGFEVVERFSLIWKERPVKGEGPVRIPFASDELDCYPVHIPHGWRLPIDSPEARAWLAARCSAWEHRGARFYHREGAWDFALFSSGLADPEAAAEGIERVAAALGMDDGFEVILPEQPEAALQAFLGRGFGYWEEPHEPNMLVFRLRT